jgi:hypothetical protein
LRPLAPDDPGDFVLGGLAALGTGQRVCALFRRLIKEISLFHDFPALRSFSAAKAVKANARERVGQPKPVRVIDTEPRTGREIKHKPKLEEIIRQQED